MPTSDRRSYVEHVDFPHSFKFFSSIQKTNRVLPLHEEMVFYPSACRVQEEPTSIQESSTTADRTRLHCPPAHQKTRQQSIELQPRTFLVCVSEAKAVSERAFLVASKRRGEDDVKREREREPVAIYPPSLCTTAKGMLLHKVGPSTSSTIEANWWEERALWCPPKYPPLNILPKLSGAKESSRGYWGEERKGEWVNLSCVWNGGQASRLLLLGRFCLNQIPTASLEKGGGRVSGGTYS